MVRYTVSSVVEGVLRVSILRSDFHHAVRPSPRHIIKHELYRPFRSHLNILEHLADKKYGLDRGQVLGFGLLVYGIVQ